MSVLARRTSAAAPIAIPTIAPVDSFEEETEGEGSVTIIVVGEVVLLANWVGDGERAGEVEVEEGSASTGKFSPGLNCIEEFFAYAN